jgi:hypothetical protein
MQLQRRVSLFERQGVMQLRQEKELLQHEQRQHELEVDQGAQRGTSLTGAAVAATPGLKQ